MKILFVGSLANGQTSGMRMQELRKLGHEVAAVDTQERWSVLSPLRRRTEQMLCSGPTVGSINEDVLRTAKAFKPELLWAEKQEYLRLDSLESLKNQGTRLLHYTPDPYFSLPWKRTRLMDDALPLFDVLVTSKRYEINQYLAYPGLVIYMALGFSEDVHRPLAPASRKAAEKYQSDVTFVGGWEPRREEYLHNVGCSLGGRLRIWGYGWDHVRDGRKTLRRALSMRRNAGSLDFSIRHDPVLADALQGGEVYGDEYAWAISNAKIQLGFLRKVWPDQHTTRTFEIPACGSMLLADRTEEHQSFFAEGREAEFFDSQEEMLDKLRFYMADEAARARLAFAGHRRCHRSGYSYASRMREVMTALAKE